MADEGVKASALPVWANAVSGNDVLIVVTASQPVPNTFIVDVDTLFANVKVGANTLTIPVLATPANSTAMTVSKGTLFGDASGYLYFADANNHLLRIGPGVSF